MFFVTITMLINYFQMFDQVWLMPMRDSAADRQIERAQVHPVHNWQTQAVGLRGTVVDVRFATSHGIGDADPDELIRAGWKTG